MEKHILIADDDPGIQEMMQIILDQAGYKTTILASAEPLLENDFTEPDIFLIDKQLSNADGLKVCRFLKNRTRSSATPVILFSAGSNLSEMAEAAGADDFLEKPFKIHALLEMIEKHLPGNCPQST